MVWIAILAAVFLILYIASGQYLREYFRADSGRGEAISGRTQGPTASTMEPASVCSDSDCQTSFTQQGEVQMLAPPEMPYVSTPIESVDDYEYNLVFQNEGNREIGKRQISNAMFRYPLDWSVQPPSSAVFQQGLEAFENQQRTEADPNRPPVDLSQFDSISGKDMVPPNLDALDADEKKILAMYSPEPIEGESEEEKCRKDTPFDQAQKLVKKIYDKRGEVAVLEPSRQGQNVWEITEVFKKDEPIVWEDEVPEPSRAEVRGEQRIEVPRAVNDLAAGLDPFFEPRSTTRMNKNDYTKWTPGLERMFAPTYAQPNWY
jgi:hypothetical protein